MWGALEAYVTLLYVSISLRCGGRPALASFLRRFHLSQQDEAADPSGRQVDRVMGGVDWATTCAIWKVNCVPRAVTVMLMLRRRRLPAVFRLGVYKYPFQAHAWVEVNGTPITDRPEFVKRFIPLTTVRQDAENPRCTPSGP